MDIVERYREPEYKVANLFINRWSPRALSGDPIEHDELMTLFEAAKWAPSAFNNQPWRFIYAKRNGLGWDSMYNLMSESNKIWAKNAAVLMVITAKTTFDNGKPSRTHAYDAGAAWANLALQASMIGLVAHGMEGFDYDRAKIELQIPGDYKVLAMAAVGRPGNRDELPEKLRQREYPSPRKPISQIAYEARFNPD